MLKNIRFSELLENKVVDQKDLGYANLNTLGDHPLFLDPILILGESKHWPFAKECWSILDDYFSTLFKEITDGTFSVTSPSLQNLREKNSFRLGYSESESQGKGCSPEMVYTLFTRMEVNTLKILIDKGIIASPMDITLYVKNFSEDRFSDLISNVLFKKFVDFTNEIAGKSHNRDCLKYQDAIGYTWNKNNHKWEKFKYKQLLDQNNIPITLVPKKLLTDEYKYSARRFFQSVILAHLQAEEKAKSNLKDLPTKKSIEEKLRSECNNQVFSKKDFIIGYILTSNKTELAKKYRKDNTHSVKGSKYPGYLTDHKLESIINSKNN